MGYILPLAHYQYKDYQKRVTKDKQDRFFIEKPYKAILESHYNQLERKVYRQGNNTEEKYPHQTAFGKAESERIYTELTGKGTRFSENI